MKISPYLRDPKNGMKSVTLTAFVTGFVVCVMKLLLSGMVIEGITFGDFSGIDFATAVGALGAIYGYRRKDDYKITQTTIETNKPPIEGAGE